MKISDQFELHNPKEIIQNKQNIWEEINQVLMLCSLSFGKDRPSQIKGILSNEFNRLGWADRVLIRKQDNLTISYLKNRIGICVQFGNVARTYADVLKLTYLGNKNIIDAGIIIVPGNDESKLLGANYANFDRLSREMIIFSEILSYPILILAIIN